MTGKRSPNSYILVLRRASVIFEIDDVPIIQKTTMLRNEEVVKKPWNERSRNVVKGEAGGLEADRCVPLCDIYDRSILSRM